MIKVVYWNSTLPQFPLETVNVLPSDVRYAEGFRYCPRIAPCARYDYLSVPHIVKYFFTFEFGGFLSYDFFSRGNTVLLLTKDPLGKDALNPVPNTDWSSRVCWRVPVKC